MKTLVHIGSHKTATTSIQSFLQDHTEELLRYGYYFPTKLATVSSSSHWPLSIYALQEMRCSPMKELILADYGPEYLANIIREVESDVKTHYSAAKKYNCHTVIWSNEGLFLLRYSSEYRRLRNLFLGLSPKVDVVCCFRNKSDFKKSYINQLSRMDTPPITDDSDSYRYTEDDSWLFDYAKKKNNFECCI